jgi:hypothetical protein
MSFSREELGKLALPLLACLALLGAGGALVSTAGTGLRAARADLELAQRARTQNSERLARIAEEEREVREKLAVYEQLKRLNILGEERRLEWADSIKRIRARRELLDVRYRVERQRLLSSLPGKPANVEFHASAMKVELALLHEEDLLRFLSDLRDAGNAYYVVRRCSLSRTGQSGDGTSIAPRLRADCDIDLVTIMDGAAKR